MFSTRFRHYAAWISMTAMTSACGDDSPGHIPANRDTDAGHVTSTGSSADANSPTTVPSTILFTSDSATESSSIHGGSSSSVEVTTTSASAASGPSLDANSEDAAATSAVSLDGGMLDSGAPDGGWLDGGATLDNSADSGSSAADDTTSDNPAVLAEAAKALFWKMFTEQRVDEGALVSQRLESALEANPGDANLVLLIAHSYLWRLAEFGRGTNPDPSQIPGLAGGAEAGFARAIAQAPEDWRIAGWLGSVMVGNGAASGDSAKVDAGHSLINQGVVEYPEFNGFVQSLVNASYPVGTPQFELALDAMWLNLDSCVGFTVDRAHPIFVEALLSVFDDGVDPACTNTLRAAHNLEGFFLYFGDLLLKANQEVAARAMYDATRASPTFDQWPYRETLVQRESGIQERLAAYATEQPEDDPPLISEEPFNCSYCHAASAGEPLPARLHATP